MSMLYQCLGLQNSANALYQLMDSVIGKTEKFPANNDSQMVGMVGSYTFGITVLRALCAERALKLAKAIENGAQWKNIHDLWVLYEDLNEQTKEEIGKGNYKTRRQLEEIIKTHRDNFNDWRYMSERGEEISTKFNDMKNVTQQIIEWCIKEMACKGCRMSKLFAQLPSRFKNRFSSCDWLSVHTLAPSSFIIHPVTFRQTWQVQFQVRSFKACRTKLVLPMCETVS